MVGYFFVVTMLIGNKSFTIGKPVYFHSKWCNICKEHAFVGWRWVAPMKNSCLVDWMVEVKTNWQFAEEPYTATTAWHLLLMLVTSLVTHCCKMVSHSSPSICWVGVEVRTVGSGIMGLPLVAESHLRIVLNWDCLQWWQTSFFQGGRCWTTPFASTKRWFSISEAISIVFSTSSPPFDPKIQLP